MLYQPGGSPREMTSTSVGRTTGDAFDSLGSVDSSFSEPASDWFAERTGGGDGVGGLGDGFSI